jgi:hypothetical protein
MSGRIDLREPGDAAPSIPRLSVQRNGREACGNPECSVRWRSLMKDRRRPLFEGRWGCTARCIRTLVARAIRREMVDESIPADEGAHRHRMTLGLILLERGWISVDQLAQARELQQHGNSEQIGRWLIAKCGVDKGHVARALAMQWGCPAITLDGFDANAMALIAPRCLLDACGVVPVRIASYRRLYLAYTDRPDAAAAFAISRMNGIRTENGILEEVEWTAARDRLLNGKSADERFASVSDLEALTHEVSMTLVGLQPRASRLVRIRQFYWMRLWLEAGAMTATEGGVPRTKEDLVDRIYTVGSEQ